jgi:hypothetical protein
VTYLRPAEVKESLAEPVDSFHYNDTLGWHAYGEMLTSLPLYCGPTPSRPKAARLTDRFECTCDRVSGRAHEVR